MPGRAYRGRRRGDTRQRLQRGVDLAQLDPTPAQLDLFVGPADEQQPFGFGTDQVTAAVRARPAQ